jgi:hypothetical protein
MHPHQDGWSSDAGPNVQRRPRRRLLKALDTFASGVFAIRRNGNASRGPSGDGDGGGGVTLSDRVLGSWLSLIVQPNGAAFPTVFTFKSNGQFTVVQTNTATRRSVTVKGSYALAPLEPGGFPFLTLFVHGQIFLQGIFAQPVAGEFFVETDTTILLLKRQ